MFSKSSRAYIHPGKRKISKFSFVTILSGFFPSSVAASIYLFTPPYAIGPSASLSGHAIAYRWRSRPKVRRHRDSKPQGSSKRVLPWQVTMDKLICVFLSHTHYYWYKVGSLKVPYGSTNTILRRGSPDTSPEKTNFSSKCNLHRMLPVGE